MSKLHGITCQKPFYQQVLIKDKDISAKIMEYEPLEIFSSIKAIRTLVKLWDSTFSELWQLTKGLQQSKQYLLK